jgi:hypothetical protein
MTIRQAMMAASLLAVGDSTWTVVRRPCLLEVVQHVLGAVSRPHREKTMIVVLEGPAATHLDEPRIPDRGEDHLFAHLNFCDRQA